MAQTSWTNQNGTITLEKPQTNRMKFAVMGVLLLSVVVYLAVNAMSGNTQLYKTVDEFYAEKDRLVGRDLRVAGFVVGSSVQYIQIDATSSRLEFDIVDNLENPTNFLHIVAHNEPKPDLLQDHAQALVEGQADANGVFTANPGGLMLKCPTRYEELEPAAN